MEVDADNRNKKTEYKLVPSMLFKAWPPPPPLVLDLRLYCWSYAAMFHVNSVSLSCRWWTEWVARRLSKHLVRLLGRGRTRMTA